MVICPWGSLTLQSEDLRIGGRVGAATPHLREWLTCKFRLGTATVRGAYSGSWASGVLPVALRVVSGNGDPDRAPQLF